jgi:hypothetical protein
MIDVETARPEQWLTSSRQRRDLKPDRTARPAERRQYDSPPIFRSMRCTCQRCGAHTITNVGFTVAGNCSNCGSYELLPLEAA